MEQAPNMKSYAKEYRDFSLPVPEYFSFPLDVFDGWGDRPALFWTDGVLESKFVLTKDYAPSEALIKELQELVKTRTAPYKYPRKIEFIDELPKTVSGKIKRKELKIRELKNIAGR